VPSDLFAYAQTFIHVVNAPNNPAQACQPACQLQAVAELVVVPGDVLFVAVTLLAAADAHSCTFL